MKIIHSPTMGFRQKPNEFQSPFSDFSEYSTSSSSSQRSLFKGFQKPQVFRYGHKPRPKPSPSSFYSVNGRFRTMTDDNDDEYECCAAALPSTSIGQCPKGQFHQVGDDDDDVDVDEETMMAMMMGNKNVQQEATEAMVLQPPSSFRAWALISKHDNYQLKIDAQENYVCFIGSDTVECHLLPRNVEGKNSTIDGRQAVLIFANGSFHLKDLNSSYGTYINEHRVPSRCFVKLNEHDEIRFGFSPDVYQLRRIPTKNDPNNPLPSAENPDSIILDSSVPMNKILRLKGFRKKSSSKEKSAKEETICQNVPKSSSKLSPSSFSLMSSSSNSSTSSSSAATSPSSVFMSAMKLMKMRFKKKSKVDKGLICSGNDDITFIRYDNHPDVARDPTMAMAAAAAAHSVSAPESPSQPRSRIFRSHTYQNEYPQPRKLSTYQFNIAFEEHDYDEVARDNDIETTSASDRLSSEDIPKSDSNGDGTLNRNNSHSVDTLEGKESDIERSLVFKRFEGGSFQAKKMQDALDNSGSLDNTTSSSSSVLPHLNSEDRLNNNSSLDVLLTDSLINKCEVNSGSCPGDNSRVLDTEDDENPHLHMDEYRKNAMLAETISDTVTFGSHIPGRAAAAAVAVTGTTTTATVNHVISVNVGKANVVPRSGSQHTHIEDCSHLAGGTVRQESTKCSSLNSHSEPSTSAALKKQEVADDISGTVLVNGYDSSGSGDDDEGYDIDDICHLRRPLAGPDDGAMSNSRSANVYLSLDCSVAGTSETIRSSSRLSLENEDVDCSRHAIGGMAFVIDFGQQDSTSSVEASCDKRPFFNRKHHQRKSLTIDSVDGDESNMPRLNSKRTRDVINQTTTPCVCPQDNHDNKAVLPDCKVSHAAETPMKRSDTFDKKILKTVPDKFMSDATESDRVQRNHQQPGLSRTLTVTMNKSCSDAPSKTSATSSQRPSSRNTQLSESAVYLINRMFEDNDYHHQCCNESPNRYVPYTTNNGDFYGPRSHQSAMSSGSDSPYGLRFNQADHIAAVPHVCNSSNASTRMEYDDSLSSLHSNCDSAQRMPHLESMATVVASPRSTLEKQVDSAIDDDGDLIPDDVSDADTYVVEIDEEGNKHHRRQSSVSEPKTPTRQTEIVSKPKLNARSSDEDLAAVEINSDYEEDFDYDDNDPEGEDKLEAARRQIDELFSNYEKNRTQKQAVSANNHPNNATFTRSKRSSHAMQQASTSFSQGGKTTAAAVVTDDKCPPSVGLGASDIVAVADKSKKRISSELMSAFKRINSKLERTARLGKLSLAESRKLPQPDNLGSNSSPPAKSPIPFGINAKPPPLNSRSAPGTPLLSGTENRKNRIPLSRTSSVASNRDYSSGEKLDDKSLLLVADNRPRARSESVASNASSQSSNLRFNRAFALRRARLGMDTCGVEISEQAATKAKESQMKSTPPKTQMSSSFRRNDGGRFSLRVPNNADKMRQKPPRNVPAGNNNSNKQPTIIRKTSKPPTPVIASRIPGVKSYSTSSSVCSSIENLSAPKKINESLRVARKRLEKPLPVKIAHSDNEAILDGDSSCDESSPFSRFGRSSLRCPSVTSTGSSSTPWLKSLKARSAANSSNAAKVSSLIQQPQHGYQLFGSPSRNSPGFHRPCQSDSETVVPETVPADVRAIPSFQVGKRFFSTKPHQMAQFDKEFNIGSRSASANSEKITTDHLMTHSVTEALLSRHSGPNSLVSSEDKSSEPFPGANHSPISPGINARIFAISPLDSLVISAINQLSSKLRTKMREFLERERTNHPVGSETRSLIDEILPQVNTVTGAESRSNSSRSAYAHESSNISRDLSNILKNMKKVEQIFDVFSMLIEPNSSCEPEPNGPIITNASDSDTSGEVQMVPKPPPSSTTAVVVKPFGSNAKVRHYPSPPVQPARPTTPRTGGGGFFIEI